MSAPSLFDRLLAQSGRPPGKGRPAQPFPGDSERRSARATAVLSREHDALCLNATDHLEIAAGLEAAGISDRHARASYHAETVFELAGELFTQVPRRPLAVQQSSRWARPTRELLARGLVYALPGLLLVVIVQHLVAADVIALLLVSVLAAGVSQALSRLYFTLRWRNRLASAAALLRWAMCGSVAGAATVAVLAVGVGGVSFPGALVIALAATYLVSATVVLLLDRHRLLLRLLIPAVALSLLTLLVPEHLLPGGASVVAGLVSIVSVVGALMAAWRLAGEVANGEGQPARASTRPASVTAFLTRRDLLGCLVPFAHGCLSMTLLSLIPLTSLRTGSGAPEALGPVMLPAMLSLGAAEVHLYGFRQRADSLLAGHHLRHFARAVRLHLLSRVMSYALLLGVLSAAVALVGHRSLEADAHAAGHLLTYLLFCVSLLVASLLVSTGHLVIVALIEAGAVMLDLVLSHLPIVVPLTSTTVHLASAEALVAAMLVAGCILLGRLVSYR